MKVREVRGIIILLPILALVLSVAVQNEIIALMCAAICITAALVVLYRHLDELTDLSKDHPKMKTLKLVTILNGILFLMILLVAGLTAAGVFTFSENGEAYLACAIVTAVILCLGNLAPKLPFNRHTGLRLPWTVTDEDTWVVAHRILGYLSFPLAVCNIMGMLWIRSPHARSVFSVCVFLLWAAIPSVLSYIFYWKKLHGKL